MMMMMYYSNFVVISKINYNLGRLRDCAGLIRWSLYIHVGDDKNQYDCRTALARSPSLGSE